MYNIKYKKGISKVYYQIKGDVMLKMPYGISDYRKIKEQGYKNAKEILLGICDQNKQLTLYKNEG